MSDKTDKEKLINILMEAWISGSVSSVVAFALFWNSPDFNVRGTNFITHPTSFAFLTTALSSVLVNIVIDYKSENVDIITGTLLPKTFDSVQAYVEKPVLVSLLQMLLYFSLVENKTNKGLLMSGVHSAIGQCSGELAYYGFSKLVKAIEN